MGRRQKISDNVRMKHWKSSFRKGHIEDALMAVTTSRHSSLYLPLKLYGIIVLKWAILNVV
jgi:hypothetical protein